MSIFTRLSMFVLTVEEEGNVAESKDRAFQGEGLVLPLISKTPHPLRQRSSEAVTS